MTELEAGNCYECNSWDDSLENKICQTCIAEKMEKVA
jgi:NMD protein affecting ribosome stability and mRNA decay